MKFYQALMFMVIIMMVFESCQCMTGHSGSRRRQRQSGSQGYPLSSDNAGFSAAPPPLSERIGAVARTVVRTVQGGLASAKGAITDAVQRVRGPRPEVMQGSSYPSGEGSVSGLHSIDSQDWGFEAAPPPPLSERIGAVARTVVRTVQRGLASAKEAITDAAGVVQGGKIEETVGVAKSVAKTTVGRIDAFASNVNQDTGTRMGRQVHRVEAAAHEAIAEISSFALFIAEKSSKAGVSEHRFFGLSASLASLVYPLVVSLLLAYLIFSRGIFVDVFNYLVGKQILALIVSFYSEPIFGERVSVYIGTIFQMISLGLFVFLFKVEIMKVFALALTSFSIWVFVWAKAAPGFSEKEVYEEISEALKHVQGEVTFGILSFLASDQSAGLSPRARSVLFDQISQFESYEGRHRHQLEADLKKHGGVWNHHSGEPVVGGTARGDVAPLSLRREQEPSGSLPRGHPESYVQTDSSIHSVTPWGRGFQGYPFSAQDDEQSR